ncbi:MAG: YeeE/YedE family protein [Flavobacteriaceae bacterium]|nr:YeeE/YedE family protein [Flavobacteriaceae bacterium]
MKLFRFFAVGIIFGIVLTKSEAVSWYRIFEMFRFESFHMYGIICTAIVTGIIGLQIIKKKKVKDFNGYPIMIVEKEKGFYRYIIGGLLFGLGWGLVGSCPGPIFILIGTGAVSMIIVLIGAVLGTFLYGIIKDKLPH